MQALFGSKPAPAVQQNTNSSAGFNTQQQSSAGGYSALSPQLKAAFDPMGTAIAQYTNPNDPGNIARFTPMATTSGENAAMSNINAGFAPTQSSINNDMAMQMNPYNDSVINTINRQGQGQYSVLKQALNAAGQGTNSNRSLLGANDIDLTRMDQIGSFLNGQFNTSMNNALTTLPGARAADAQAQMGVGSFLRGLDTQQKMAPVTALQAGTGMMAPFLAGQTSQGSSVGTTSSTGQGSGTGAIAGTQGLFGQGGNWVPAATQALSMFMGG